MKTLRERGIPIKTEVPVVIPTSDGNGIAETIMIEVEALKDPNDGEIYLNGETLERLDRIKARRMGILLPAEIRELRERLTMTQAQMADLLGIGEKSYSRWETGRERLSHSLNKLLATLWEGRLTVADLQATRQPAFPWFEHVGAECPRGTEHKPHVIAANAEAPKETDDDTRALAA